MRPRLCTLVVAAAVTTGLLPLASCARPRPSVLLVSIDSLRYDDAFGSAGGRAVAPRVAALAQEALVFDRAYSTAPWTTPSMMSVMTGMDAEAHGVEEHDRALASGIATLAERFRAAGYETLAVVPEVTLRPQFGFGRGFDHYDLEFYGHSRISSPALVGKLMHRLGVLAEDGRPFFAWIHLWDPHYNYNPPPPFDVAFPGGTRPRSEDLQCLKWFENVVTPPEADYLRGRFRGEIAFTDHHLGALLDFLAEKKLAEGTIVAVMADHGEAFGEHGWLTHTNRVDEEVVHVPLLLRWPGKIAPGRRPEVVSTVQLGRTLLQLAGLPHDGFGLAPALPAAGEPAPVRPALAQTIRQGCYTALHEATLKYVLDHRTCGETLFDLTADPAQVTDVAASRPADLGRLRGLLRAELDAIRVRGIPKGSMPQDELSEALAQFRSLGYVGGGAGAAADADASNPCAGLTHLRDSFGDAAAADACPSDGARRCLERLQ